MNTIAVLGTLDTKGVEHAYVAEEIRRLGCDTLLIDVGTAAVPSVEPDIGRFQIIPPDLLASTQDRGEAIARMSDNVPRLLNELAQQNKIQGVISLGGSGGTAIATAAMRALPLGFPKLMVSTMASGNVSQYLGVSDITMMPSIVDVSGLNRISKRVFKKAAAAIVGMVQADAIQNHTPTDKPIIAASMFGNTTKCIEHARKILEAAGYEVLVFHATGVGGRTMEALIASGAVDGVLDLTTTEWADQLVGGVMPGGEHRLEAAARQAIPAVVAPGCLDMVNFGEPATIPNHYSNRRFYQHNPQVTLMRTNVDECTRLGQILAQKLNQSIGPVEVLVPRRAVSVISAPGQPFHDPEADQALFDALRQGLRSDIQCTELDVEINDPQFAEQAANRLIQLLAVAS